jgi:ribosome-associated protein
LRAPTEPKPVGRRASPYVDGVDETADALRVNATCAIPMAELDWRFSRSGGPGGQHANTSDTRVEVVFDIARSPSLTARQRDRLLQRIGPVARAVAADERSQARNRALAADRLRRRLAEALRVMPARRATRPTLASRERRLNAKHHRSDIKRLRRGEE